MENPRTELILWGNPFSSEVGLNPSAGRKENSASLGESECFPPWASAAQRSVGRASEAQLTS